MRFLLIDLWEGEVFGPHELFSWGFGMTATTPEGIEIRPVPGYPEYGASADGRVWTCKERAKGKGNAHVFILTKRWRVLRTHKRPDSGHWTCSFRKNGQNTAIHVHRLVLMAFVGPCPDGMVGCHNDGNTDNNAVSNLRWDTQQSNMADKAAHGTKLQGECMPRAKLTDGTVREARELILTGKPLACVARQFGVGRSTMRNAIAGRTWKHVS